MKQGKKNGRAMGRGEKGRNEIDPFLAELHELRASLGRKIDLANPKGDLACVMRTYGLPKDFPKGVKAEAAKVDEKLKNPGRRLDLRGKFIFTCDPETAKDYDDALSLEKDKDGNRVLGVHIADVSHFVTPGSALDREAEKRSTSVYFPGKVVPMLPEELSNGVCSLVPGEDRLAFSAFLTFDRAGRCVKREFAKSTIRSKARFTYEQVMSWLASRDSRLVAGESRAAVKTVREISRLAQQLRANRFKSGGLDMAVPEAEILVDDGGEMTGVTVRPYDESHQMIEECMVAANAAVAQELWTRGIKILARFHDAPDAEKLEELRAHLAGMGVSCGDLSYNDNLAKFLAKIKGDPLEGTIAVMVLRSMKRAVYSSKDMGHYGLALKFYAHFTSPIRRYPDLTLHRQLAAYLAGKNAKVEPRKLAAAAKHVSEREQWAADAERALVEIKKYRYLDGNDATFDAVVSKCFKFGMFVDLPDLAVGGLVHISKVSAKYARYDPFRDEITDGSRTWKVGDKLRVRVAKVDLPRRLVDFVPAPTSAAKISATKNTKSTKKK